MPVLAGCIHVSDRKLAMQVRHTIKRVATDPRTNHQVDELPGFCLPKGMRGVIDPLSLAARAITRSHVMVLRRHQPHTAHVPARAHLRHPRDARGSCWRSWRYHCPHLGCRSQTLRHPGIVLVLRTLLNPHKPGDGLDVSFTRRVCFPQITGPLIRVVADRFAWQVKVAILETLESLIGKVGPQLKAFLPQLQTTFVKVRPCSKSLVPLSFCDTKFA